MSSAGRIRDRRALAWTGALAVPILVGAGILVPIAASGAVDLPDKSVQELIEFAGASEVDTLTGTIEQASELGLPDLDALTGASGADDSAAAAAGLDDVLGLIAGTHTANVYLDGERARLQVLDRLAERNVYVDGDADIAWYVDSESQTATRLTLPSDSDLEQWRSRLPGPPEDAAVPTPQRLLEEALARLDESTEVTVGTDARVAGRDVYELILTPRAEDTLIGDIRFAIDGQNGAALAASITARGSDEPAFQIAFTRVGFEAPDPAALAFTPADGIAVVDEVLALPSPEDWAARHGRGDPDAPTVYGRGWSAVVQLPETAAGGGLSSGQRAQLEAVTTAVEGGRVLQTSLISVLITDDGRMLAGAVPASRLVEAAQTGR
ncbi:DUF2092 domain-containing protein [Microbacterium sp. zg.B48]|uniref:LolA family protein n=1 Tax=Microbacterium sp. zg.B48 TaxID=2969408 RepID=UPI00214A9D69|nr:DUF2092 domain-containing protein [Microbacterium sp. zg.B48]MCR2763180.1 DUF2092 domain-containing protein [Microbacterium sp. zg.B48]